MIRSALLAAVLLVPAAAFAQSSSSGRAPGAWVDGSATLSTTAAQIFAASPYRVRIRVLNTDISTSTGGTGLYVWCRWGTTGVAPASAHGVGSFMLPPGGGIDDQGAGVNTSALNCVAESGAPVLFAEQY